MRRLFSLYRSTVGKKILMAASGVVLVLFVLGHMAGNLKAFQGPAAFDAYAEFLREVGSPLLGHGELLWIVRAVLVGAVAIHILAAWQLTRTSHAARPVAYRRRLEPEASTYASRTMRWGGVVLVLFVVYHLLHFTFGTAHPDFVTGAVYHNVIVGFRIWWVVAAYTVAMLALGFHLYHGVWSAFQTLGVNHPRYNGLRRPLAGIIAVVVVAGFLAVPLAVATGVLR